MDYYEGALQGFRDELAAIAITRDELSLLCEGLDSRCTQFRLAVEELRAARAALGEEKK